MILTHDQFGMIPQSPEMQKEILEGELQNLEDNLAAPEAHGNEISRGMLKGVQIRKQNLAVRLKTLEHGIENRKDDVVDFKMSLDMRMINRKDEYHTDNKASHCAANIAKYYNKFNAQKGTRFVFYISRANGMFIRKSNAKWLKTTAFLHMKSALYRKQKMRSSESN